MPSDLAHLRPWLVHDWLTGMRGGEKVLLRLVELMPQARIATLVHVPGTTHPEIDKRVAAVSFLNRLPGAATGYRNYLPLFPRVIRSLHLDADCDLVISVSHAVAKGVRVPPGKKQICYCCTPMRYIWGFEDHYLSRWSPKRAALALVKPMLRRFDRRNVGVSQFIAVSHNVAERIQRIYNRDSRVIFPAADVEYYQPNHKPPEDFYLAVSALVGYKRIDVAVDAFRQNGRKLVVIGGGPELGALKALAADAPNIHFLGRQPDDVLRDHYQRCRAFVFPGEEDFGITPVEAQACGRPVIAYGRGGALETVVQPTTGVLFDAQTPAALTAALERFEQLPFDANTIRNNALRFTWAQFDSQFAQAVHQLLT